MTRARRNIYDGYCPICGKSGCDGSCIWPIPRLAAGPIPVPEGLAERVYQAVCEFIHTYWGRTSEPLGDRSTRIVLTTKGTKVHGQPVPVIHVIPTSEKVLRPHGPLLGAFTYLDRPIPEIVVQFNGSKTGVEIDEAMRGLPGFKVQGWLHHELAHVFDKIPKGVGSDPWEDSKVYYNDPVEVRAYSSQVWRYVMDNRDYYAASEGWIQKTGEKGLWELVDSAVTGYVGAKIRNLCTEKNRRYILQTAYHALQEAVRPSKVAADESGLKADLMRVRPILRAWTAGGWTDGPQLLKLLEKHKDILAKFRPTSPLRLWRNERIEGPDGGPGSGALNNHGWEDQYTRPTAWSARRTDAETYAAGKGRRLVTAIVPPEDMYVSIPMVDHAAKGLGMKPFDPYAQSEVIVRPNPSFLDQLRPPVKYTREEEAKIREQLVEQLRVYYAPQVKKLQEQHPEGAQGIAQRAEEQIQGMVSSIHTEELPEKVKEWTATIQQWEKTASVVLRASKTLYHGTTRDKAQEILKYGLAPDVGSLTTRAYGDEDADLQPLTFAADREGLGGGVFSALLHAIGAEGHPTTDEIQAIRNWGAVVVIKEGEDTYQHRPGLDEKGSEDDYVDYPTQVESGDYYSEDSVDADYAITGPALVRWLTRNGVNLHQGYADPITRSERNRLIGWVHRVHPSIPMQEIIEKVTSLPSREFRESWIYYKKALSKAASMPTITTQAAHDRGMFGPVFHGTTEDTFSKIQDEGFKLIEGQRGDEGVSNGYASGDYSNGIPAPAHHLGFGIYFTTVKNIAKYFAGGSTKTLKPYYLDVHNVETINFGSPNTMMRWWIANGYDPELAKKDRMAATKQLTETLRSKHDAVWFKGKGLHALLDKDQIVVFDPSKVYVLDDSKAEPGSLRSKVQRKSDGMVGVLLDKRPLPPGMYDKMMAARETLPEDQRNSHWFILTPETKYTLTVKWQKGGTDHNVYDTEVTPYQGKQTRAAALLGDIPAAPGTTPIKPGYVRLYHQTGEANLQSIEKTGLRLDHAKGVEGPRAIYAGEDPFYGDPESIPTLEFQVPRDKWNPPFVMQDVMPEDFIAAHYPWHRTVRYLESEPESLQLALAGRYDSLGGNEGTAVAYVKKKYGKTASAACVPKILYWGGRPGCKDLIPQNTTHKAGIWLTDSIKVAASFGTEVYQVEVSGLSNPFIVDAHGEYYSEIPTPQAMVDDGFTTLETCDSDLVVRYALEHGYDSVIIKDVTEGFSGGGCGLGGQGGTDYILLKGGQAKVISSFDYKSTLDTWGMPRDPKFAKIAAGSACVRAWITPDGQVKEFPASWGHSGFAKRELKDDTLFDHQAVDMLRDKGWARMGTWDDLLYIEGFRMTPAQFNAIQSYVQANPQWQCPRVDLSVQTRGASVPLVEFLATNKVTDLLRKTASAQTDSPAFKAWFQGSKIVDAEGYPLKMYHGAVWNGPQVSGEFYGGTYVTPDPDYASGYARRNGSVYPLYVKCLRPVDFRSLGVAELGITELRGALEHQGINPDSVVKFGHSVLDPELRQYATYPLWGWLIRSELFDVILKAGFDGVWSMETGDQGGEPVEALRVESPQQLKSATGNNGDFDPENKSITAREDNPAANKETEEINERKKTPAAQKPHKFEAAKWTHPNGHPRCRICGDEEPTSGRCGGASKTAGNTPWHGWLLPDGSFRSAEHTKLGEHWEVAHAEFGTISRPIPKGQEGDIDQAMRKAFDEGWIRVSVGNADTRTWTDEGLHRLQVYLMGNGELDHLRYYYVDSEDPKWSVIVEPAKNLLTLNKVSDLRHYQRKTAVLFQPRLHTTSS